MPGWITRVRRLLGMPFRPLRGRDVALRAAAATFYGEGLRRAFVSLREPAGPDTLSGWKGRLLWLPLLAAAPALLLAMFLALPVTSGLWIRGGWYAVGGVVLSFLAAWLLLTPVVVWVY